MKKIVALVSLLLLFAATAFADSTISGLQPGSTVQTQDFIPVFRPSNPGTNFKVQVGSAATQNIGTSGATLGLLNTTNTYSALQTFLSGDLSAADPVFSGGSVLLPSGTTGSRPSSPVTGMVRYNTSLATYEAYSSGAWSALGSGSSSAITALTGDGTASGTGSVAFTLATVNSNVGAFGSASTVPQITTNGKGLITGVASVTITPAAIGAPTTTGTGASGTWGIGITGNAATVTTNANLTGPITSVGNATSVASQTGTGSTFAMSASPTFTGTVTLPAAQVVNGVTLSNANASTTYLNGAGSYTTPAGSGGLTVGTTSITSGTTTRILFDNAGTLAEYTISGTGNVCMTSSCVLVGPALGTPVSGVLTNATGLPISTGVSGLGTGVATLLSGSSSGTGGPAGTASPTFTGTVSGAAATWTGVDQATNFVASGTGADTLPVGTTAQRPGSPAVGMIRYNSSAPPALEAYINGQWSSLNGTPNVTYTGTHTLNQTDMNGQVNMTGTWTLTIPAISTTVLPSGNYVCLNNQGSGTITVTSTPTINLYSGTTTSTSLASGQFMCLASNGATLDVFTATAGGGSMVYPAAGISNSTGSAWGTSYGTTGTGTSVMLAASPTTTGTLTAAAATFSGGITATGLSSGTVAAGKFLGLDVSNNFVLSASSGSTALSALTGGTGANSIDSATNTQTWTWNTLASQIGLALSTNSTAAASNTQELLDLSLTGANGTTTQTTYGEKISNAHTGTSSTNVGLSTSASGGTTNIALQVPSGAVTIGTTTPVAAVYNSQVPLTTIQYAVNNTAVGLSLRNTNSGASAASVLLVQNDSTDFGGFQINSSGQSTPGGLIFLSTKSQTFLSDIGVSSGGSDSIRFQAGGYSNALTLEVTAGNPGKVRIASTVDATNATLTIGGGVAIGTSNLTFSPTAPTVSSGFGTSPSFGTGSTATSWDLNVGTGGSATSGVITMPTAAHKWTCDVHDETSASTLVTVVTAQTTTSITLGSFSRTTGSSTAWNASDIVMGNCSAH